jgi:hypothetical protein
MKRAIAMLVGISVLLGFHIPWAEAITIKKSVIDKGKVKVVGKDAVPLATILWEGSAVTTANKAGKFSFSTTVLPSDCLGELSDGMTTIQVGIGRCTTTQAAGLLLATGQTTSYHAGDDGDLELGAARSYTDNGDGTITDNATGLMWEKLTDDGTIHDWDNTYPWADAFDVKIAALNTVPCFAGHCDWRLPNLNELRSIVNYGLFSPAIDATFGLTKVDAYWSSTTNLLFPSSAYDVRFSGGGVATEDKVTDDFVRAVRGP